MELCIRKNCHTSYVLNEIRICRKCSALDHICDREPRNQWKLLIVLTRKQMKLLIYEDNVIISTANFIFIVRACQKVQVKMEKDYIGHR